MTFTASTCLTDLGGITLTDPIKFYSDVNNFLFEFGSANLSELTGSSCPYILQNIPDGTKVVKFVSENNYCATVDVEKLDCDFFSFYLLTNNEVSRIKSNGLQIISNFANDYSIAWYGPNNKNNLVFTSGKGSSFTYDFTHPINQLVEGGTYYPVVQNIKLDNKIFSNTGGTGQIYADLENCLEPQIIQPCACGNRTAPMGSIYNHTFEYVAQANIDPVPVTLSLELTAGTKFVGWSFQGITKPDRVTIYFKGSSYPVLIGLDDWEIGSDLPAISVKTTDFPKSATTGQFFSKIISLEKFNVNQNDKIIFVIKPKDNSTSWNLKYTCLTNKLCESCNFNKDNFKIVKSGITFNYNSSTCDTYVKYDIKNMCSLNNSFFDYSLNFNYFYPWFIPYTPGSTSSYGQNLFINRATCYADRYGNATNPINNKECTNRSFKYTKSFDGSTNVYTFSGNPLDINAYFTEITTFIQNYSGTTTTDNSQLDYYNAILILVPAPNATFCPDSLDQYFVELPVSSIITKSIDSTTLTIKPSILTYNPNVISSLPPGSCTNCDEVLPQLVNSLNSSASANTFNYTAIIPNGRPKDLVYWFSKRQIQVLTQSASTINGYYYYTPAVLDTIPFSGVNNTLIPSLSATTCQSIKCGSFDSVSNYGYNYLYGFTTSLINPLDPTAFKITATEVQNCSLTTNNIDIYIYSGGTVQYFDPNYII